ncbi:hypothetical protein RBS60_11310 [Sinomonas sp. ASV486]|uniref:hypothetical protein n=1 Tax=Sinomonas sp. ASV486 TaxID=3051170 RepID=UPI0027DC51C4|nr:hypothetical protein [Sinomonas sp. ASV486]MDQ4490782.1 hypothetical protein [Sinomonas sp. ASV486]
MTDSNDDDRGALNSLKDAPSTGSRAESKRTRPARRKKQRSEGQRHTADLAFRAALLASALQIAANGKVIADIVPELGSPENRGRTWAALGEALARWNTEATISTSDAVVIATTLLVFTVSFNIAYVATLLIRDGDSDAGVRNASPGHEDSAKEQWAGMVRGLTVIASALSFAVSLTTIAKPGTFLALLTLSILTTLTSRIMYVSPLGKPLRKREVIEAEERLLSRDKNLHAWEAEVVKWKGPASGSFRYNKGRIFFGTLLASTVVASVPGMFVVWLSASPESIRASDLGDWLQAGVLVVLIMIVVSGAPSYLVVVFSHYYFVSRAYRSRHGTTAVIVGAAVVGIPYFASVFFPLLVGGSFWFACISLGAWSLVASLIWVPWIRGRGPGLYLWASVSSELDADVAASSRELASLIDPAGEVETG